MILQKNKFKEGDIVYEITRPQQLLFITRRNGAIYYCRPVDNKKEHELAFMERDLKGKHTNQVPNEVNGKITSNPS